LEVINPTITIKVTGSQWYWSYEYSDYVTDNGDAIAFDSYMIPESDLELGQFRLLDVDNKMVVPVDTHIRLIVTSNDVIHSFAVPSLGLKLDCTAGRLNQVSFLIDREGVFYGQCSEICGLNALYQIYRILLYATTLNKILIVRNLTYNSIV